jgi:hypothetical protein
MYLKLFTALYCCLFIVGLNTLCAQQTSPRREVGLQISSINFDGLNTFSAIYKKEIKENLYRRIDFTGSFLSAFAQEQFTLGFNGGLSIGREKRRSLDDKLIFYQGPQVGVSFGLSTNNSPRTDVMVGLIWQWFLGLQHSFNARWAVNMEITPGVAMNLNFPDEGDALVSVSGNISNRVRLGVVRKF